MFGPDTKSIEHKHTVSTTQIDNNRHRGFCNAVGVGPQDYRHFL